MDVVTFNRRTMVTPYLALVSVLASTFVYHDAWLLFGLLAVYLGWIGTAPNLNLADGCIAQISLLIGVLIGFAFVPRLLLFGGIVWVTWFVGSLELALRTSQWPRGT